LVDPNLAWIDVGYNIYPLGHAGPTPYALFTKNHATMARLFFGELFNILFTKNIYFFNSNMYKWVPLC
jgi:hypothetical protein